MNEYESALTGLLSHCFQPVVAVAFHVQQIYLISGEALKITLMRVGF